MGRACGGWNKLFAGRKLPASIADLGNGPCSVAVHGHLKIVNGLVDAPVILQPDRVVTGMAIGVPALDGQVHAADERQ